jgi:hypothetical protein
MPIVSMVMRLAAALLTTVPLSLVVTGGAQARTLSAQPLPGVATFLGAASNGAVAFVRDDGRLVVRVDTGVESPVAVPPGCTPVAAGSGRLLFGCGAVPPTAGDAPQQSLLVTDLRGGESVSVQADQVVGADGAAVEFTAVGAARALATVSGNHYAAFYTLDWRTGGHQTVAAADVDGRQFDLDGSAPLSVPCAPLDRMRPFERVDIGQPPLAGRTAPWALRRASSKRVELWRCGARRPIRQLTARGAIDAVIGHGRVAWSAHSGASDVRVLRLRGAAMDTVRASFGRHLGLTLTQRSLYVADVLADGHLTVRVASLPALRR